MFKVQADEVHWDQASALTTQSDQGTLVALKPAKWGLRAQGK